MSIRSPRLPQLLFRSTLNPGTPLSRSTIRRHFADKPPTPPQPTTPPSASIPSGSTTTTTTRLERVLRRLPKFTHRHTTALLNAPLSHISTFLILHELTAIIPLFGLAGFFHYTNWLPPFFAEGRWVSEGVGRFGKWMRKRGWISEEERLEAREAVHEDADKEEKGEKKGAVRRVLGAVARRVRDKDARSTWWGRGEGGVRVVVELATAYAVVKALIIPRVVLSVWATPWAAGVVVEPMARRTVGPVWAGLKTLFRRGKGKKGGTDGGAGGGSLGP